MSWRQAYVPPQTVLLREAPDASTTICYETIILDPSSMVMYLDQEEDAMKQYNIAEAKARFSEMVRRALMGEEVIIARGNKPLLKLTPIASDKQDRRPGTAKGQILFVAPDFDRLPPDFAEYT